MPQRSRYRKTFFCWLMACLSVGAGTTLWTVMAAEKPAAPSKAAKREPTAATKPGGVTLAANVPADHAEKMTRGLALFKKSIGPALKQHCVECHGGDQTEADFDLTDRERLIRGGKKGPGIEVGQSKESLLFQLVNHAKKPHMPQGEEKLSAELIADIGRWIDLGAPYDSPLVERQTKIPPWYEKKVPDEARRFWSFQRLQRVEPPTVRNPNWCRTPIDRFVLHKLEAAGIAPNPALPREKLVRRLYFDLIGLPPTPQEVTAFVEDQRPDAYERLVDRLLASPRYGERWARFWLDLARFAESHGYEQDYDRPFAYHYRDFVIEALNRDLPYHTFVKWQLAGDEYEPENNLALKATGYLAAGVHPTQITANEVEKSRYDELDDIVNNLGTTMLGLTIGCCRCHDHKYDPLPQGDYYRMLSTFSTTVRSEVDLILNRTEYARQKQEFDAAHAALANVLKQFDAEAWPARFGAWEKSAKPTDFPWLVLEPKQLQASSKSKLSPTDDGIIQVQEEHTAPQETYTVTVETRLSGITSFRLEILADPLLPHGGPGRGADASVLLTAISAELSDILDTPKSSDTKATPQQKPRGTPVKIAKATATNSDTYGSIQGALDDNPETGWTIPAGKDQIAVFELDKPVGAANGSRITFTLRFHKGTRQSPGRFRLSATSRATAPEYFAEEIREAIANIVALPSEKRTTDQRNTLEKWRRATDEERSKLQIALREHLARAPRPQSVKALISTEGLPAVRLHTQGADFFEKTFFLRRGDLNLKEGVATPSYLQVLMTSEHPEKQWRVSPPTGSRTSFRRRALAEWLTDVDTGAGSLLARVLVNRLWQGHLGRGIVATSSDFGTRGEKPTHAELLDWLAAEFIRGGWSIKQMHRLIVTSSVYLQSSDADPQKLVKDSGNRWFWRKQPRRLEAETIRDALLAVSRQLDPEMFGPGTLDLTTRRRSIYFFVKRSKLIPMLQVFDATDSLSGIGERQTTTVAPQALLLLNNPQIRGYAKAFARSLDPNAAVEPETAVKSAYHASFGRAPTPAELSDSISFIRRQQQSYDQAHQPDARHLALSDFCQTLFCLNEFVYVE